MAAGVLEQAAASAGGEAVGVGLARQAVAAGVVEAAAAAEAVGVGVGSRLGFRHGLIRQVLYEGIPAPVREALHLQAAGALAAAGAAAERVAAQLVAAPGASGEWVWGWLAGAVGVLAYRAPGVAAELVRRALAQLPEQDERREVLEAGLVRVAFLLVADEEVERVARPLLARTADPDRAAEVAWLLAYMLARTSRAAESAAVTEEALARPGTSQVWAARLRARQATTFALLGRWDQAAQLAGQALTEAEQAGPTSIVVASDFLAYLEAKGCSPNTVRAYAFDLRHFDRFLQRASLRWDRLTTGQAVELLLFLRSTASKLKGRRSAQARLSPASVNRILAAIASFYEWAV